MPVRERVRSRSVDLAPEDYPYETPKEVQGTTHKLASRQLEHALDLHLSRRRPAGTYALLGDQGLQRRGGGDPRKAPAPDIIVYLQAPDLQGRQTFVLEADGPPDLVMEILSEKTWKQDVGKKRGLYAAMGIGEYWIYDPQGHRPRGEPRVQGFRQAGGRYAEIAPTAVPRAWNGVRDPGPLWRSEVLQTSWGLDARGELRLRDPQTGDWYPTLAEHDRQFLARGQQLDAKDQQIAAQGQQLGEKDRQIVAQGQQLGEKDQQLDEKDQQIRELKAALARYQKPRDPQ